MLNVTHTVYEPDDDGGELLCLHETDDGRFIYDPHWEGADVWLTFGRNQEGEWYLIEEEAIPMPLDGEDLVEFVEQPTMTIIGKFETIDDAVRHYWKNILGC